MLFFSLCGILEVAPLRQLIEMFLILASYAIAYMCHSLFNWSMLEHSGSFLDSLVTNNATVNSFVCINFFVLLEDLQYKFLDGISGLKCKCIQFT